MMLENAILKKTLAWTPPIHFMLVSKQKYDFFRSPEFMFQKSKSSKTMQKFILFELTIQIIIEC